MSDSDYTPLASLSGEVKKERDECVEECHVLIEDLEQIVRRVVNVAAHDFHVIIARLSELKNHPHLRRSDD